MNNAMLPLLLLDLYLFTLMFSIALSWLLWARRERRALLWRISIEMENLHRKYREIERFLKRGV